VLMQFSVGFLTVVSYNLSPGSEWGGGASVYLAVKRFLIKDRHVQYGMNGHFDSCVNYHLYGTRGPSLK